MDDRRFTNLFVDYFFGITFVVVVLAGIIALTHGVISAVKALL